MSPVEIAGWSLIHFLWEGAAIYLLLWLALSVGRNLSAAHRYAICCFALLAMSLCPVGTAVLLGRQSISSDSGLVLPLARIHLLPDIGLSLPAEPEGRPYLAVIVLFWLCGSCFCSLRLLAGLAGIALLRRRAEPFTEPAVLASVRGFCARLRIRCPRIVVAAGANGPSAFGVLRPAISIPISLVTSLPAEQLDALLAHELAHIRRHDYLVNIWQSLVEALLFYHPAVWWVSNRIRAERELACDDLALQLLTDPRSYARALASLESTRAANFAVAASGGDLLYRIRRILENLQ